MRIRAAVLNALGAARPYADSRPLGIEELELEPPGPGEALVRIRAAFTSARALKISAWMNRSEYKARPFASTG